MRNDDYEFLRVIITPAALYNHYTHVIRGAIIANIMAITGTFDFIIKIIYNCLNKLYHIMSL